MATSSLAERVATFRNNSFLGELGAEAHARIAAFARDSFCKDGAVIFSKGDPGDSMMFVMSGKVRIRAFSEDAKEITYDLLDPGELFGEIALLDGKPRSADAVACGLTHLLVINRADFFPFLESHPRVAIDLLAVVCARARNASEVAETVAFLDIPVRLARLFLKLAEDYGVPTKGGTRISLKLSQRDLGNMIASSRETVNKVLGQWTREQVIHFEDGAFVLRDAHALERIAEN